MDVKKKFYISFIMLQVIFAFIVFIFVNLVVHSAAGQDAGNTAGNFDSLTAAMLGIGSAVAIAGSVIRAGKALGTVGAAAISTLTENEALFFKAFLVVALAEALAIYGLIVSILLWIKIPTPV